MRKSSIARELIDGLNKTFSRLHNKLEKSQIIFRDLIILGRLFIS